MKLNDSRNDLQKQSFTHFVVAQDKFMSGWGEAENGKSYCAWACDNMKDALLIKKWVSRRGEMRNVYITDTLPRYRKNDHLSVYVVEEGHIGLWPIKEKEEV